MATYYLIDNYTKANELLDKMKVVNPKNRTANWFAGTAEKFADREAGSRLGRELRYSPIPEDLKKISDNPTVLSATGKVEDCSIKKVINVQQVHYITPAIKLDNLVYQLVTLKQKNLLLQHQNDIFSEILWFIWGYDNNIAGVSGNEKKTLAPLTEFAKKLNREFAEHKIFQFAPDKATKQMAMREYVSKNYKIEDFTKYKETANATIAVMMDSYKKDENTVNAYKSAINMNSIVQMRDLIADDNYREDERRRFEKVLDNSLEEASKKVRIGKDDAYYEFKKNYYSVSKYSI